MKTAVCVIVGIILLLLAAGCSNPDYDLPQQVVCTAPGQPEVRSDLAPWWSYEARGNAYSSWSQGNMSFAPPPGYTCRIYRIRGKA